LILTAEIEMRARRGEIVKSQALRKLRAEFEAPGQYKEIWAEARDGQAMVALVNGDTGWLMYVRHSDGDAGFSSRNPAYSGPEDAVQDYRLSNGQSDEYPLAWALPVEDLLRAMEYFVQEGKPPTWIHWHNDSGDGVQLGPGAVQ